VPSAGAFVLNPRKFPRVQAKFRIVVKHAGAGWSAETFDVGPTGCQIVTPRPMTIGEPARLVIDAPGVTPPLSVLGKVAWVADQGRIRAGIAYAERQLDSDPTEWFRRLMAAQPALEGASRRLPDRLPVDAVLYLRPPPRFIFDFGADEVEIIRAIGDGSIVANMVRLMGFDDFRAGRAIFALLEKRVITLAMGEAAPAWKWKAALASFEAPTAPRPEEPPAVQPAPATPPPKAAAPPAARAATQPPAPLPPVASRSPPTPAPLAPVSAPAAAAPSRPATKRSPEAQECVDLATSAASMGELSTAIGLLRRALQLCPRDPEIASLLGQLAFRDRQVEP
jgi:hypothetical protein